MNNLLKEKFIVDDTDHFFIICSGCGEVMGITKVKTFNKCTYLFIECKKCGRSVQRKIYWEADKVKEWFHYMDAIKHMNGMEYKKRCKVCNGNGEIKHTSDIDGYDLEECPNCKGKGGFITT